MDVTERVQSPSMTEGGRTNAPLDFPKLSVVRVVSQEANARRPTWVSGDSDSTWISMGSLAAGSIACGGPRRPSIWKWTVSPLA
jgi:hypothetical protein